MPLVEKIKTEAGLLGIWKRSESAEELEANFQFTSSEKAAYKKYKIDRRKIEFLSVRILLQELAKEKLEINYLPSGKPELNTHEQNISISHSANFVVILLSDKKIGIDVENTQRNVEKVVSRYLHKKELEAIENTSNPQIAKILYWGAKEAVFKTTLHQNIEFKTQIIIDPFELKEAGEFTATLNKTIRYHLWYKMYENNVIVYCVEQ